MVFQIHFRSVKWTAVTKMRQNFEQLFIPIQAMEGDYSYSVTCLYCICLFKLSDTSIVMLQTNNITNIYSEIIKIRVFLWLILAMWKSSRKLKRWVKNKCISIVHQRLFCREWSIPSQWLDIFAWQVIVCTTKTMSSCFLLTVSWITLVT